jgi:hypothetical protein
MSAAAPQLGAVCSEPKVFVGQLPPEATQQDVTRVFEQYGAIRSCGLIGAQASGPRCAMVSAARRRRRAPRSQRDTPSSRSAAARRQRAPCQLATHPAGPRAQVLFDKWSQAEAAVESEQGKSSLGGSKPLVVRFADPPRRGGAGGGPGAAGIAPKKLFVGQVRGGIRDGAPAARGADRRARRARAGPRAAPSCPSRPPGAARRGAARARPGARRSRSRARRGPPSAPLRPARRPGTAPAPPPRAHRPALGSCPRGRGRLAAAARAPAIRLRRLSRWPPSRRTRPAGSA